MPVEFTLVKDRQGVASREDVKVLRDVRVHGEFGPLVLVECRHLADGQMALCCQRGNDSVLVGLSLARFGHGAILDRPSDGQP